MTGHAAAIATCPAHLRARIVAHAEVAERTWRLRLECPALAARALPGQFAMLRIPDRDDPLLARPLAVYDVAPDEGERRHADFIYLVHGKFTRTLRTLRPGDEVAVWGPLGNGFHLPAVDHLLLVAGGIGQTALLALARERSGQARYGSPPRSVPRAAKITFCWGVRHAELLAGPEDFRAAGCEVALATLDGSAGLRGTVVDLLDERCGGMAPAGSHVACCGPEPMMAAVAAWCAARGLPCAVSLETPMACGVGICFSCVAPIRDADGGWDYRRTCVEGPVFDARSVAW